MPTLKRGAGLGLAEPDSTNCMQFAIEMHAGPVCSYVWVAFSHDNNADPCKDTYHEDHEQSEDRTWT